MKYNNEKEYSSAVKLATMVMLFAVVLMNCNRTGITDAALPEVIATTPVADAEEVPLDAIITANFSEEMDTATFNTSSFRLTLDDSLVPGIVSVTPTSATFVPLNNLLVDRTYTVTITTEVTDAMGYTMGNGYEWQFSTISGDAEPTIEVTSTSPPDHSTGVDAEVTIIANFSEEMNPVTVNTETFTLRQGTNPVSGTVSLEDTSATFTPSGNLNPGVTYTATVTTGAESVNGYNLAQNYSWSFTTAGNPDNNPPDDNPSDIIPPEIADIDPNDGENDVRINTAISVTFNEEMNAETINTSTFILRQEDNFIEGTVEYSGTTATFIPEDDLLYNETYGVTITDDVEDTAGNNLPANAEWNFSTEELLDDIPPEVVNTEPEAGNDEVDTDTDISVTFSEAMNPETINNSTFILQENGPGNSGDEIPGSVEYSGGTATFTPSENLNADENYLAIISTEVEDAFGNNLEEAFQWGFRTRDNDDDDDD